MGDTLADLHQLEAKIKELKAEYVSKREAFAQAKVKAALDVEAEKYLGKYTPEAMKALEQEQIVSKPGDPVKYATPSVKKAIEIQITKAEQELAEPSGGVINFSEPSDADLRIEDISSKFSGMFSPEAEKAMETKFKESIFPKPERKTIYLSATANSELGIEKAARAIADEINFMASTGNVLGVLSPLSIVRAASSTIVFCFVTVPYNYENCVLINPNLFTEEGDVGKVHFE